MKRTTRRKKKQVRKKRIRAICILLLNKSIKSHSKRQNPSNKQSKKDESSQTPFLKHSELFLNRQIWPLLKLGRTLMTSRDKSWWEEKTVEPETLRPKELRSSLKKKIDKKELWLKNTRTKKQLYQPKLSRQPTRSQRNNKWEMSSSLSIFISCRSRTRSMSRKLNRKIRSYLTLRSVQERLVQNFLKPRKSLTK